MAHAIKRYNGHIIWFDAVTSYTEDYSGQSTSHPIENGSNISDFVIINNPRFSIQGVITDADFNTTRPVGQENEVNNNPTGVGGSISIKSTKSSPLISLLPESILGLLQKEEIPKVIIEKSKPIKNSVIKDALIEIQRTGEPFSLLSFTNGVMTGQPLTTCVLTQLSFNESPDSGDALYPQMSFERLQFVTLRRGTTPFFRVIKELENKAADLSQTAGNPGNSQQTPPTGKDGAAIDEQYRTNAKKLFDAARK